MIAIRCLVLGMLAGAAACAAPLHFQSAERQTTLVELYTSEGCSSCPPAESWLSRLKEKPGLWNDFVPVAFHVDYWDYLGWRDKWASKQFSDRQRDYSQSWRSESVYTPGFVLNGKEWRGWSGQAGVPVPSETKAGLLNVNSDDGIHWQVSFTPASPGLSRCELHAALLGSELSSHVKAGENAGRDLKHDFAVLSLIKQPLTSQDSGLHGAFVMNPRQKAAEGRLALAFWVTGTGRQEPVQAAGGWLPQPEKN